MGTRISTENMFNRKGINGRGVIRVKAYNPGLIIRKASRRT
jgi:hypothetical protein